MLINKVINNFHICKKAVKHIHLQKNFEVRKSQFFHKNLLIKII